MKLSTVLTVSFGLLVGAIVGITQISGRTSLPAIVSQVRTMVSPTADEVDPNRVATADSETAADSSDSSEASLYEKAEAYLENNPHDRQRALIYGGKLVEAGEFSRAENFYKSRLSNNPNDADFVYGLGWAYEKSKQWSKAANAYQRALEFDPQHLAAQNNLAWVLATAPEETVRDGARAVKLAEAAMAQAGSRGRFVADTLAAAYAEAGKFDFAIKFQKWVVNESPANKQAELRSRLELYLKGQAYRSK